MYIIPITVNVKVYKQLNQRTIEKSIKILSNGPKYNKKLIAYKRLSSTLSSSGIKNYIKIWKKTF